MAYINSNFWKKAYLIEFKQNGVLTDAFTFSVPPESEEFSFPQRKSETKTFGGAVVADYGNDLVNITLSGSTINQELKLIYKSRLGEATMTGEQEIFYLRDLLKKYGSRSYLQGKEVYLYSLNGGGDKVSHNPKWWQIFIGQLDINRSKDKPFCYNYKLTATGAPEITKKEISKKNRKLGKVGDVIDTINDGVTWLTGKMTELADKIEEFGGDFIAELSGYISAIKDDIDKFNNAVAKYVDVFSGMVNDVSEFATDTVMLGDKVLSSVTRFYPNLGLDVWNTGLDVVADAKNIYSICANFEKYFTESPFQNIKELYDEDVDDNDIADTFSTIAYQEYVLSTNLMVIISKNINDIGFAVVPGGQDEDDTIITTYGYKNVTISDSETNWEQLANDYYGDASLGAIIATYNNLNSDTALKAGQEISIPNLNFAESKATTNEVYNTPDVKDNYGKDMLIKDNDFAIVNGDIALSNGIGNLEQSLINRYSTMVGSRIRVEAYGIQATIGDSVKATSALIQSSVHQTTIEDPRVEEVEDITFEGMGDNLSVKVTYKDKNGTKRNLGGMI